MKTTSFTLGLLLVWSPLAAQEATPPSGLAAVEAARSRACVPALARLAELNVALEPYARGAERLRALDRAIALEDSTVVAPFDTSDATERAVREWFLADLALARRYVAERDEAIQEERSAKRRAIRETLQAAMDSLRTGVEGRVESVEEVESSAQQCDGAILLRPAVLEACGQTVSPVCDAARAAVPGGPYRFVEAAEDLWDVEELRPWSEPGPLRLGPDGAVVGARTAAQARLGNIRVAVAVAPIIRERSALPEEEVTAFDANLDSLGIPFEHARVVMAPSLELLANVPPPIDGETHLLLHLGDLSGEDDVVWSAPLEDGGIFQTVFPATGAALQRLAAGEPISVTAVRVPEGEDPEATPVYSVALTPVNQAAAVRALLEYMTSGSLSRDLALIVPPAG